MWWPVLISGLLPGLAGRVTSPYSYPEFSRISLRIHHNGKSTERCIVALSQLHRLQSRYDQPLRGYLPITFRLGQCSYLLCPRLFRGVTPYRHDGESLSCMHGMACTFRLPAGPCTKEPPDRYRRMCHTPDAFTPGSALRHLSNDKATNGREWGALSCCVYQKGNNLSSKGQYTTTNKSYVVKLVII